MIPLNFNDLFQKYDDNSIPLKELTFELRKSLMKLLDSEELSGAQRDAVRERYSVLDKRLDEYVRTIKLLEAKTISTDKLKEAESNLQSVISQSREILNEIAKRSYGFKRQADTAEIYPELQSKTKGDELNQLETAIKANPNDDIINNRIGNYYFQKEKDYNKAIEYYEKSISLNPNNYVYYLNIGDSFYSLGDYNSAKQWYEKALQKFPDNDVILNSLGNTYSLLGEYDRGIESYRKATAIAPKPIYLVNIGDTFIKKNDLRSAVDSYESSLLIDQDFAVAHDALADAYKTMYNQQRDPTLLEKSIEHYEKSLNIEPNNPISLAYLGDVYFIQKNYDKAISNYERAVLLNSDDANSIANIGYCYFYKNKYEKALERFNAALAIDPNNVVVLKYLGDYYKQLKDLSRAADYYNSYIKINSDSIDVMISLCEIYSSDDPKVRNVEKALSIAKKAIEKDPNNYLTYEGVSRVYAKLGNLDEALDLLQKAVKLNDRDEFLYLGLGSLYITMSNFVEAFKSFNKAIALNADSVLAYDWLAYLNTKIGKYDEAESFAKMAGSNALKTGTAYDGQSRLAQIYHAKGLNLYNKDNLESAISEYKKANEIRESDVTYYNLYLCYFKLENHNEARIAIERAIALAPGNSTYEKAAQDLKSLN